MALVSCKECGHNVSDTADKCPSCGVKLRPKTTTFTKVAGVFILLILAIAGFTSNDGAAVAESCRPLDPVLMQLPASHAEAQTDFIAKAEQLRASGVCVIEGNWGKSHQKFYFAVHPIGQESKPYFIRLNREQLKP